MMQTVRMKMFYCWLYEVIEELDLDGSDAHSDIDKITQAFSEDLAQVVNENQDTKVVGH